ncbi:GGDEF domain-containing protein [Lacticaseibacillus thailandensis]|nr:GGDEF domain-containing protein [Lacticaseibacillus thailandensis]
MNVASYVTTFFIVVISMLGFTSVYSQIEAGTRQRVAHMRMLARVQAVYPLLIYICLMLILLRYLYGHSSNLMLFWAFVNIQSTILIYSNLLTTSLVGFAIIQTVGAITYISTGAMSITNWILFLFACLVIYAERWYGQLLHQQRWVYFLPALFVGTLFWVNMYLTAPRPLPLGLAIANLISFGWAYFALWDFDQYLQHDQQVLAKLTHEAQYDALTRARNWATFRHDLNSEFADQDRQPLALVAIDLDHFKSINDTYGHLMGNQTLIAFSRQIQQILREQDDHYGFYRTGGEEFALLLPNTNLAAAQEIVAECQRGLKNMYIPLTQGELQITASFGLAIAHPQDNNATNFFKRSDRYLYRSKHDGRDRLTDEADGTDDF